MWKPMTRHIAVLMLACLTASKGGPAIAERGVICVYRPADQARHADVTVLFNNVPYPIASGERIDLPADVGYVYKLICQHQPTARKQVGIKRFSYCNVAVKRPDTTYVRIDYIAEKGLEPRFNIIIVPDDVASNQLNNSKMSP